MYDADFGNKYVSISQRRYLGSKKKLLGFIDDILKKEHTDFSSFADIFSGTGVVADFFSNQSDIIVNDILESNHLSYQAFFGNIKLRENYLVNKINEYNLINASKLKDNYFSKNFAETYFDLNNSKLIGYIRDDIEKEFLNKKINTRERAYLITSLIYALDKIANTVGHYDAYRKIEIKQKRINLAPLKIRKSSHKATIFKQDANQLVRKIKADVVYIDPPYNSRQYSDAYHLLENIAEWKKEKVYGVAKKINRDHIKSNYSLKSAGAAFSDLINNINAKYILVSYNDMGTSGNQRSQSRISDKELVSALERRGTVKVFEKNFNQFTTGSSTKSDLKERVFFCKVIPNQSPKPTIISSSNNMHLPRFTKSPLNYTGGKHKLLPQISKLFPTDIETFYDIFCGGGNVGVNANAKKIVCIDKDKNVISLLKLIKDSNFDDLNNKILKIISKYNLSQSYTNGYLAYNSESSHGLGRFNKDGYEKLKNDFNLGKLGDDSTVGLLVIIFYSFNNQIRFNKQGKFNLPVGKRDFNGSSRKNLANFNFIANLRNIKFQKGDFRDLLNIKLSKNDFVYFDPPYLLGLASYNESGGWTEKDEKDLYLLLESLDKKNIKFALSNVIQHKGMINEHLIQLVRKNKFIVHDIKFDYKNSNYQSKAKNNTTKEVLITNYK
jgi:adenine-specific DNA-methyltransferase